MSDASRHLRGRDVFLEAAALSGSKRDEYLRRACAGDQELLDEVESLLRHHEDESGETGRRLDELKAAVEASSTVAAPPALEVGDRLGDLEILGQLGRGGMGEVYRAVDRRLEREVAVKVLPRALAARSERLARLEREARALGKLNHPNVATLYGIDSCEVVSSRPLRGDSEPLHFLLMELVEGESLEQRFRRGPVAYRELVPLLRQVADALKAAHDVGVVHRDVKPANVMVDAERHAGGHAEPRVKLLDFGLARLSPLGQSSSEQGTVGDPGRDGLTRPGVVMGTVGYMAPEQVRGEPADRRTDVWAFGCCLYEGLTGVPPFEADSDADSVAAVLTRDPDWERMPRTVPQPLRDLLSLCLEKQSERRLQDLGDAQWFLARALEPMPGAAAGEARRRLGWWRAAAGAVSALLLLTLGMWLGRDRGAGEGGSRAPVLFREVADPTPLALPTGRAVAVAPEGRSFFYVGQGESATSVILRRDLARPKAVPVAGTEGASTPFVSEDGRWLGFYRDGALFRVPVAGGEAQLLGKVPAGGIVGATWMGERIVLGVNRRGLFWIDGLGAEPAPIRSAREDVASAIRGGWYPTLLTRDEVLFDVANFGAGGRLVILDLRDGGLTELGQVGLAAQYVDAGYLVWAYGAGLWACRFDLDRFALMGSPVRVQELDNYRFGSVDFSVSRSGTLVSLDPGDQRLVEVTPDGRRRSLEIAPGLLRFPRWSPDGRLLAYVRGGVANAQIWLLEAASGRSDRLVSEGSMAYPVWAGPDELLYFDPPPLDTSMSVALTRAPVDHRSEPSVVFRSPTAVFPLAVAGDGSILVRRSDDLWVVDPESNETRPWLESEFSELNAAFSPDGALVAYDSDATGEWQVYVRRFDAIGGTQPASAVGCGEPTWSGAGGGESTLYFRCGTELRAVGVRAEGERVAIGAERVVVGFFPRPAFDGNRSYDPRPDGSGFVTVDAAGESRISVAVAWAQRLRELVPGAGS